VLRSGDVHEPALVVTDIGWKARGLVDGAAAASVVAALSRSLYVEVGGEIVWLGPAGSTLHGRAILAGDLPLVGDRARLDTAFDLRDAREWRPPDVPPVSPERLAHSARRLAGTIEHVGSADGFGALLVDRRPAFPLDRAAADARDFLHACARDEPLAAAAIAVRLLGLGPGLTPAGDDLIGGAFFAGGLRAARAAAWRDAAALIRARAPERTHRISATLLGDLLDGHAYAPLHDLAAALAREDASLALDAAARLTRIGHSSGWDMLAGFLGTLDASIVRR
jgi:hypothetical protein